MIGLVTDALSYKLLLVSAKEISHQRVCFTHYPADDLLLQIEQISSRLTHLSLVSNIAFGLSGLLTDVMLVSTMDHNSRTIPPSVRRLTTGRFGVADRYGNSHFMRDQT